MDLVRLTSEYTNVCRLIRAGDAYSSISAAATLLESLLREAATEYLPRSSVDRWNAFQKMEKDARKGKGTGLGFLLKAYEDLAIFQNIEKATSNSTSTLGYLNLKACNSIRVAVLHRHREATLDEARFLISTIEPLLAYFGVDVDGARSGDAEASPIRASNKTDWLLRRFWTYPDGGGSRTSWAVKESAVVRGHLEDAIENPGLGIALFTTELATELFGSEADAKIRACVEWGLQGASRSAAHMLTGDIVDKRTGRATTNLDFRHTIALAILMNRVQAYPDHVRHYLKLAFEGQNEDGGWSHEHRRGESELPSTAYCIEFLSGCRQSFAEFEAEIDSRIDRAQGFIMAEVDPAGGWRTNIFKDEPWEMRWSTAYLLQRLFAAGVAITDGWNDALQKAGEYLLDGEGTYRDPVLQFRVEARVAAALAWAGTLPWTEALFREAATAWLSRWKSGFMDFIPQLSSARECDIATTCFALRGLKR